MAALPAWLGLYAFAVNGIIINAIINLESYRLRGLDKVYFAEAYRVVMVIIFIAVGVVFYYLYIHGFLFVQSKRAVMFAGSIDGRRAIFSSCSGYRKRVMKFKESRVYNFVLNSALEKGDLEITITDSSKQPVLILNGNNGNAAINADKKKRYYLVFSFKSATF